MFKHNNMRSDGILVFLFIVLAVSAAGLLANYSASITGAATSASTTSQAVIEKYFSINVSANLSDGIDFGTIATLPAVYHNSTLNYNDTNYPAENDGNESLYFITVEYDSNTPVDICVMADALNTSGGLEIGLGNYSFANNQTNNITWPGAVGQYTMSTSYQKADTNIAVLDSSYFRFWLDVPAATPTGTYNNTVTFLGRSTGTACP
jgi:archaellum component FlaG (FlaF/FlaG flagellin family)